jgi:hypothetical protein
VVLLQGTEHASWKLSAIQYSELLKTGQFIQLWHENLSLLREKSRRKIGQLVQGMQ